MWKCKAFVAFFIAVLFFPAIAWANPKPSFDCAKASSFAEKAICSNDDLAQLDVRMSKAYKAQLAATSNITSAKAAQRAWVKKREACGSVACIRTLYAARIPELGGGIVVAAANNADEPAGTFVVANTLPPDDYLSLRTEPSTKIGSRITKMANGTELKVLDRRSDGWWRVEIVATGQSGWASSGSSKKYIVWKPSTKTASTTSTTNAKSAADAKAEADARAARNAKAIADAKAAKAAAKIAADEKAAKLAADKAREAAAEAAEKDQAISLISVALGNPDPADLFVFLNQGGNAPNLAKNLDGQLVSATGTLSVCHSDIASPYSGERGERYSKLVSDFLATALPSGAASSAIDLAHCGANAPIDAVYFQLGTLASTPDPFVSYLKENLSANLIQNGSFTLTDAKNAEAVFQAEKEKEIADKIATKARALNEIRTGTEEGYGFITISSSNAPLCYFNGGAVSEAFDGKADVFLKTLFSENFTQNELENRDLTLNPLSSLDDLYINITRKPPNCGWMFGNRTSLNKISAALDRDGIAYNTLPYWLTADELRVQAEAKETERKAKIAAEKASEADQQAALAEAERAANQQKAEFEQAAAREAARDEEERKKRAEQFDRTDTEPFRCNVDTENFEVLCDVTYDVVDVQGIVLNRGKCPSPVLSPEERARLNFDVLSKIDPFGLSIVAATAGLLSFTIDFKPNSPETAQSVNEFLNGEIGSSGITPRDIFQSNNSMQDASSNLAALSRAVGDPSATYSFSEEFRFSFFGCKLIEYTITTNGQDWTMQVY